MLAKTADDDLLDITLVTAAFLGTDAGGEPPIDTPDVLVTERRKPQREKAVDIERVLDDDKRTIAFRYTAKPGHVLDNMLVLVTDFEQRKCLPIVETRPTRGKPRGDENDRVKLTQKLVRGVVAAYHAARGKPETNNSNSKG
jgi:hypothetical protein